MLLTFQCPRCELPSRQEIAPATSEVDCPHCEWSREITSRDRTEDRPNRCLACGCTDLWRQKDFPQRLGVAFVVVGATLSTIAWAMYNPLWAFGILGVFALIDLALYTLMGDVLVCYRCSARHSNATLDEDHARFDLEVAERYRQESLRLKEAQRTTE